MSNRLDQEREKELEPERMKYAIEQIEALGYKVEDYGKSLWFTFKGKTVMFYPYSGWATGKTIQDGRGIAKLLKQIKPKKPSRT